MFTTVPSRNTAPDESTQASRIRRPRREVMAISSVTQRSCRWFDALLRGLWTPLSSSSHPSATEDDMADDQLDEWTPEAMANYDAAHARLISTLDQFTAGLRTALPTRAEGPELEALRVQVD